MQKLTAEELMSVKGGRNYEVVCYSNNRPSTGYRGCGASWQYQSKSKLLTEFMHGRHISLTGHRYATFNW